MNNSQARTLTFGEIARQIDENKIQKWSYKQVLQKLYEAFWLGDSESEGEDGETISIVFDNSSASAKREHWPATRAIWLGILGYPSWLPESAPITERQRHKQSPRTTVLPNCTVMTTNDHGALPKWTRYQLVRPTTELGRTRTTYLVHGDGRLSGSNRQLVCNQSLVNTAPSGSMEFPRSCGQLWA